MDLATRFPLGARMVLELSRRVPAPPAHHHL